MVTDGHCKVHQCILMMGWLGGPSRDLPLLFFWFHPPLLFLEIISISFPKTPSAFATFHVWLFHKAHSWKRRGCFHTESKDEKDQQISSNRQSALMDLQDQVPEPGGWCVDGAEPPTANASDSSEKQTNRYIPPHHSPVFYPSLWPGSKSRAVRPGRYSRNRKASPLHGSAVDTLHPWRKPRCSNRNPSTVVSFYPPFYKASSCAHKHLLEAQSCEMRHLSRCFSTCVCMYVCVKAAVVVLPYVGFTVSHFNDTHSSTQAAIVHPSVQPRNMDKKI